MFRSPRRASRWAAGEPSEYCSCGNFIAVIEWRSTLSRKTIKDHVNSPYLLSEVPLASEVRLKFAPMDSGLAYDSRKVKPGYLFFAFPDAKVGRGSVRKRRSWRRARSE